MLGLRGEMEEPNTAPPTQGGKRSAAAPPDSEVVDRPLRRPFAPSYKPRIAEEADRCAESGDVGQLLRGEGLYTSHLTAWRKAARSGSLPALSKQRRRTAWRMRIQPDLQVGWGLLGSRTSQLVPSPQENASLSRDLDI
jgi:hypothetical protein